MNSVGPSGLVLRAREQSPRESSDVRDVVLGEHRAVDEDQAGVRDHERLDDVERLELLGHCCGVGSLASVSMNPRTSKMRTFFWRTALLSARSRFQHPLKYSKSVWFLVIPASTVMSSGSSVMLSGERESRARRI